MRKRIGSVIRSSAPPLTRSLLRCMIPPRPLDSHKGMNGHVLILAGSRGMSGAAVLCALGALRAGAGLVTVGIIASERLIVTRRLPEVMTLPLAESRKGSVGPKALATVREYVRRRTITALAVGPGLSVHPDVARVVRSILGFGIPMVLDADALNNLTTDDFRGFRRAAITPHPGELARLLGVSIRKVQSDRVAISARTAKDLGVICVLKGYRTVVSDGRTTRINPTGNPAMAVGGMGDVLTGMVAGFLAQKMSPFEAACAGVYLHGLAGDLAKVSDRGLLATELANRIPLALKKIGVR